MSDTEGLPVLPPPKQRILRVVMVVLRARESVFQVGNDVGDVELWIDDRLAFRSPNTTKVVAVLGRAHQPRLKRVLRSLAERCFQTFGLASVVTIVSFLRHAQRRGHAPTVGQVATGDERDAR